MSEPATKADIEAVKADIEAVKREMATRADLTNVESRLDAKIDATRADLASVESRLDAKIDATRADLTAKLEATRVDFATRLDTKIDEAVRILMGLIRDLRVELNMDLARHVNAANEQMRVQIAANARA